MNGITDVLTLAPQGLEWQKDRLCDEDPDLFFPESNKDWVQIEQAKAICKPCPVQSECLTLALEMDAEGVWGGMSDAERTAMKKRNRGAKTVVRNNFAIE